MVKPLFWWVWYNKMRMLAKAAYFQWLLAEGSQRTCWGRSERHQISMLSTLRGAVVRSCEWPLEPLANKPIGAVKKSQDNEHDQLSEVKEEDSKASWEHNPGHTDITFMKSWLILYQLNTCYSHQKEGISTEKIISGCRQACGGIFLISDCCSMVLPIVDGTILGLGSWVLSESMLNKPVSRTFKVLCISSCFHVPALELPQCLTITCKHKPHKPFAPQFAFGHAVLSQ